MLSEYRVLDLTDERGHLAAFILAQMGAEVIAIEPPAGSSARQLGPFADDVDDGDGDELFGQGTRSSRARPSSALTGGPAAERRQR